MWLGFTSAMFSEKMSLMDRCLQYETGYVDFVKQQTVSNSETTYRDI